MPARFRSGRPQGCGVPPPCVRRGLGFNRRGARYSPPRAASAARLRKEDNPWIPVKAPCAPPHDPGCADGSRCADVRDAGVRPQRQAHTHATDGRSPRRCRALREVPFVDGAPSGVPGRDAQALGGPRSPGRVWRSSASPKSCPICRLRRRACSETRMTSAPSLSALHVNARRKASGKRADAHA